MKYFDWSGDKNEQLKKIRGISFEEVLVVIEQGQVLDIVEPKNRIKYPGQKIFIIYLHGYVYVVPFVEDKEKIFLKTIFPSRQATKKYISDN